MIRITVHRIASSSNCVTVGSPKNDDTVYMHDNTTAVRNDKQVAIKISTMIVMNTVLIVRDKKSLMFS